MRKIAIAHGDKNTSNFLLQHFQESVTLSVRMQGEVVISAALVVLAIAISAALVAICIVVGSAFISIVLALTGREPKFFRASAVRRRTPAGDDPDARRPTPDTSRERERDDLATDIMSNAAEGIVVD